MEIIPTVGRIVYYKSFGSPNGEYEPEIRAAIITKVESENCVGLAIINPTGMFFNPNVTRGDEPGQWDWMDYQKKAVEASQPAVDVPSEPVVAETTPEPAV